ncbi:MAG: fructosamine kinase family protein [Flavobacteriales bacterium]
MKTSSFAQYIEEVLKKHIGESIKLKGAKMAYGGSINECYILDTNKGNYFIKRNDAVDFPGMFSEEAKGLIALRSTQTLRIPEVIEVGHFKSYAFLLLEYLERGTPSNAVWDKFGEQLALLHKHSNEHYGWSSENYIGSLNQTNTNFNSWTEFLIHTRLESQALLALTNKKIDRKLYDKFQQLYTKLDSVFPVELPAMLHGDLWSGNFLALASGEVAVFDPAIYYGHREMDLAMTRLFGGFNQRFYDAYNAHYPLINDWQKRVDICQLYPLLVHVNLFGGGYVHQVEMIVKKWTI